MKLIIFFTIITIGWCCCTNSSSQEIDKMDTRNLEKKLIEFKYSGLFLHGSHNLADSIWQNGESQSKLEFIIQNASSSTHAKFLAAELLRHFEIPLEKKNYEILAETYCYALENSNPREEKFINLNGNLWGFLYELDDSGYLGKQLVEFGDVAVPSLEMLLENNGNIPYEGSREAMTGNAYLYRIKDFAAFYISKIKNIPIEFYQDIEERDREIERFKKLLNVD